MTQELRQPFVSVVIPTFNRPDQLVTLLDDVAKQCYPCECFEVVIVDDGSETSYDCVARREWRFELQYARQKNAGEAIARNYGAERARGSLIVFLDDDMSIVPEYIQAIVDEHIAYPESLLIGMMHARTRADATAFERIYSQNQGRQESGLVAFTEILAGVLVVPKGIYQSLSGMFPVPDAERGSWIDIDFGYRAHLSGVSLRRVERAVAYHTDYAARDLTSACRRQFHVSLLAPALFQLHPGLSDKLPMFRDKYPVRWKEDSPALILRKLARRVASFPPILAGMEWSVKLIEGLFPSPHLLRPMYRWIIGGYIYNGYHQGLVKFQAPADLSHLGKRSRAVQ